MTEVIIDDAPTRGTEMALVPSRESSGLVVGAQLADLSDQEFQRRLDMLQKQQQRIAQVKQSVMVEGQDFGTIRGTKRPTLLKGGAEKLCNLNGLVARMETQLVQGNGVDEPLIRYDTACTLHVGSFEGPAVAVGHGTANSWERKYRYVGAGLVCPDCGRLGVRMTRRNVYWHPLDSQPDGGCDGNFSADDQRLSEQTAGKVEDSDPWDKANTLLKMSEKRAHVDATLRATATSGLFTQDVEDIEPDRRRDAESHAESQEQGGQEHSARNSAAPPPGSMGWYKERVKEFDGDLIGQVAIDLGFASRKPIDLSVAERKLIIDQAELRMKQAAEEAIAIGPEDVGAK